MVNIILMLVLSYFVGGLNFSIIISKIFLKNDVRQHGSGNAGFTNSLRSFGKGVAALVLAGDVLKTVLVVVIARMLSDNVYVEYAAVAGVILGHNFPALYRFKGGKGIVTTVTAILLMDPVPAIVVIVVSVLIMFVTRYVSVGSVVILLSFPVISLVFHYGDIARLIFTLLIALLGLYMHRGNISRLIKGTENRFGGNKS